MFDLIAGSMAAISYGILIATYLANRPKRVVSVMDLFIVLLSVQFGPHAIIYHSLLEAALLVPEAYPAYALGLSFAYLGLAIGLGVSGAVFKTRSIKLFPPPRKDLTIGSVRILIMLTLIYLIIFVALQGFDLSRTINYLNFFRGSSVYTYTELRREMYEDEAILGVAAVTRQTTSAVLYATLIYAAINIGRYKIVLYVLAGMLFVICCLQMNKFPILYYGVVTYLVFYFSKTYSTGRFISGALVSRVLLGLSIFVLALYALYNIQYASSLQSGLVQSDRIIFRVITRPFTANHDALYLWFAHIPVDIDFVGLSNIKPLANFLGIEYHSLMIEIPAIYTSVKTTYQAGFIGSCYGSFGYPGILVGGALVGVLVGMLTRQQSLLKARWQVVVYGAVVGMNFYFLDSRELHTSMLSGGIAFVPIMFALISKVRLRNRGTAYTTHTRRV